jgi:predicted nucleotidyltransferase component of viral defense system
MKSSNFKKQVNFLLDILPVALSDERLALKGGTALNLFVNNMPRLSVDIDLTYLPIEDRNTTLSNISIILSDMVEALNKKQNIKATLKQTKDGIAKQVLAMQGDVVVKIELNLVIRGSAYEPIRLELCKSAQDEFQKYMEVRCLPIEDLYGGKFCASLDRGHPRDLFDMIEFFKQHQITDKIKNAFLFYLLSSNRPIAELLQPGQLGDFDYLFNSEFEGMVTSTVTAVELLQTRARLIKEINNALTDRDKDFLLSFKKGQPKWELSPLEHLKDMPSIKWKLHNIQNIPKDKHTEAVRKLEGVRWSLLSRQFFYIFEV